MSSSTRRSGGVSGPAPASPLPTSSNTVGSGVTQFYGYSVGELAGSGSMAQVHVAHHIKSGVKVAFKRIPRKRVEEQLTALTATPPPNVGGSQPRSTAADAALRGVAAALPTNVVAAKIALEVKVLSLLKHPHVIRLYDVIFTPTDVVLVLEFAQGGELFDHLNRVGRFSENHARALFQQIMSALEYCHANRVAHRDLKPENILLDAGNWSVKLTDFDLAARIVDGQLFDVSCGTPNYASPEVITGHLYNGPEADCWSAGVVLYAMLTGSLPFDDENIQTLFRKIRDGVFKIPSFVSPAAKDLLRRMLVVDPLQRATVQQVMAHPWVRTNIPRYIVDIHEACMQQVTGIGQSEMTYLCGPYWDGFRDHGDGAAGVSDASNGIGGMRGRAAHVYMGSTDDFHNVHLSLWNESPTTRREQSTTERSLFPPPGGEDVLQGEEDHRAPHRKGSALPWLDTGVVAQVADLVKSTPESVRIAITRAMRHREHHQAVQLHLLVHGRPPLRPPTAAPSDGTSSTDEDHDLLITYVILRHRQRAEASTRHRDPARSVSLGGDLTSSLRAADASRTGGGSFERALSASHALDLQERCFVSNVMGQGSLGHSLRSVRVGQRPIAPAPGQSITNVFSGGTNAATFDGMRALDPSSAMKDETDSSRGSSQLNTRTAAVVRQPPPLPEPLAVKISAIPQTVYNGVAHRPGLVRLAPVLSAHRSAAGSIQTAGRENERAQLSTVELPLTSVTREQEAQHERLGQLLDKTPQFSELNGSAAAEVWAQTFRLGVMSEDTPGSVVFLRVFDVLKEQGYVWKVLRPYVVCALCHATRTKIYVSLVKCANSVADKFLLDVRLAPCCAVVALHRVAETMEAFALKLSGPASVAQTPQALVARSGMPAIAPLRETCGAADVAD